jgi:hypothetical protein
MLCGLWAECSVQDPKGGELCLCCMKVRESGLEVLGRSDVQIDGLRWV